MNYYPIYIDIRNKLVTVIGGGGVALRKVQDLLAAGAVIRVISPEFHDGFSGLISSHGERIEALHRPYMHGDLKGSRLVFSATNDSAVNREVFREAEEAGIFINAVDDPPNCSFIIPSSFSKGDLSVCVSTGGASPAMSAKIRRLLEENVPDDIETILEAMKAARTLLKEDSAFCQISSPERGALLKRITAEDALLSALKKNYENHTLKEFLRDLAAQ